MSQQQDKPGEDELVASNTNATGPQGAAGGMGVSSEREGQTRGGEVGTDGQLDTAPVDESGHTPPEQSPGGEALLTPKPPKPPKSGYNSRDPRSKDAPFEPGAERGR